MSELSTQMDVLGFLQENLFEYQMNYFKSHLMTYDQMMEFMPEKQKPLYFSYRDFRGHYTNFREYDNKSNYTDPDDVKYKKYNEKYVFKVLSGTAINIFPQITRLRNTSF